MKPSFLFAPGAGAPSINPWMQKWKRYLLTIGEVILFDYDYLREGRTRPDPLPQLLAAHRRALVALRGTAFGGIFLVGKRMCGRIGCHLSLEEKVAGLIWLGYPLRGGGCRAILRGKVARELQRP